MTATPGPSNHQPMPPAVQSHYETHTPCTVLPQRDRSRGAAAVATIPHYQYAGKSQDEKFRSRVLEDFSQSQETR